MKWLATALLGIALTLSSAAQTCEKSETACLLDAAWSAALVLPEDKRDRLAPQFLELAMLSDEPELLRDWEARFERNADTLRPYPDYGWQTAEPLLRTDGVDGLIARAESRAAPLSFGRADVLLAAGKHFRLSNPRSALRLNQALLSIAKSASKFERPSLAHAAAELAMARCDLPLLEDAIARTDAPNSIRYAFWRARIAGDAMSLLPRVRAIDTDEDTREVRRVLNGYRAILELGYCSSVKTEIGG